ncbi:MAG: tetratricopeptide repeat protein [Deferribacteraceae bacterium]|jgi:tetratricopeptide (TPR) repeat protein|nr:tetratricopeptide repeat protein [Deferribacteraceae bacterium]
MYVKMRALFFLAAAIAVMLLSPSPNFAQEILLRKDAYHSEVFLKMPPADAAAVERNGLTVIVRFKKTIKNPFDTSFDDRFIAGVKGGGNIFSITFKEPVDFAVFNDPEGLRFVAALPKTQNEVLLSYGLNEPILRKEYLLNEDPMAEAALRDAERLVSENRPALAVNRLTALLDNTSVPYYRQEALYKLGLLYMDLSKNNPDFYLAASSAFDDLIREYPDSIRINQIRMLSAEAKKNAEQFTEAINAYQAIFDNSQDAETRRDALSQIGQLYENIGQFDRAIAIYERYLSTFRADSDQIKRRLGRLYIGRNYRDKAFGLYSGLPIENSIENLADDELLGLGKIFEEYKKDDSALKTYSYINDNSTEKPEALYRTAQIFRRSGNPKEYSDNLEKLINLAPQTEYGNFAAVEYGEIHYADRPFEEWQEIFEPLYNVEDIYDLRPRALMVMIRSLHAARDTERLVPLIDEYLELFSTSKEAPYLLQLKEDVLYAYARNAQDNNSYDAALQVYSGLLDEFPDSKRAKAIAQHIDDIHYDRALSLYNNADYAQAAKAVEERILTPPKPSGRWYSLYEDAVYQDVLSLIGSVSPSIIRYKSRDYLAENPRGRYVPQFKAILKESLDYPIKSAYNGKDYVQVVELYNENADWINIWPDQGYADSLRIIAANSLLQIGLKDKAQEIFKQVTPNMTRDYALLAYTLCQKDILFNINRLSSQDFAYLTAETKSCGLDYQLSFVRQYKNRELSLKAEYEIMKGVEDERTREDLLSNLYNQLQGGARFEGYQDVYLDTGLAAYRRNDFSSAAIALKAYTDNQAAADDDKRTEALYYLGKSLFSLNEKNRGLAYMQQAAESAGDSIYKTMAKGELASDAWKKSLSN